VCPGAYKPSYARFSLLIGIPLFFLSRSAFSRSDLAVVISRHPVQEHEIACPGGYSPSYAGFSCTDGTAEEGAGR
jgi:hypothetical protein